MSVGFPVTPNPGADPNLPGNPFGGFGAQIMPLLAQWYASSMGGVPAQFTPQQGFHDQLRAQQQMRDLQAAMGATAAGEAQRFRQLLQGGVHLGGGNPNDPETAKLLGVLQNDYQVASPYLMGFMPRWLQSAIGGRQGSVRLAGQDFIAAGMNQYDPATGAYGLGGKSAGLMATQVASMLYGEGTDPAVMRGIKIDEASQYLMATRMRGEGPRSIRSQLTDDEIKKIEAARGGGNFDIRNVLGKDRLSQLSDHDIMLLQNGSGSMQEDLINVDAKRMAEYMKDNVGMMRAMKDVFGPNTDWAQAIQMVRDMTQGNAQGLSKSEMEMALRNAKEVATAGRMSLEQLTQVSGFLANFADSQGMNRRGAFQAAQGVAAFRGAFETLGMGNVDKLDVDKLSVMAGQLQVQAGNSPIAARLGATLTLADATGGFKDGSRAARYLEALKSGATSFEGKSIYLSQDEWRKMMQEGGVDKGLIRDAEMSREMNTKAAIDAGLDATVRRIQFQSDISPLMINAMRSGFGRMGVGRGAAASLSNVALDTIMGMDHEMYAEDKDARMSAIVEALRKTPEGAKMSEDQLKQLAGSAVMSFETVSNRRGWGSGSNVKALFDPKVLAEQQAVQLRSGHLGDLAKRLSGLGMGDITTRLVESVMSATEKTSIADLTKAALNIVDSEEVQKAAQPHLEKIAAEREAYLKMLKDPNMQDPTTKALNEAGKRAAEDHFKQLERMMGDMKKDVEAAAGAEAKKPTKGKSSDKDPTSSDLASGGKEEINITGTLSFGGLKIPLTGTGTRVYG